MSWQSTTSVTAHSQHKGSDLLCLLMLSNYADAEGGSIHPSVERLSKDCRMSRRGVQIIVARLVKSGELVPDGQGPMGVNKYRLNMGGAKFAGVQSKVEGGCNKAPLGGALAIAPNQSGEQPLREQPSEVSLIEEDLDLSVEHVLPTIPFEFAMLRVINSLDFNSSQTFITAWADFVDERKKRKKPLTDRAAKALGEKLAVFPHRAEAALKTCIERGWLSFEWEWLEARGGMSAPNNGEGKWPASPPKPKIMLSAEQQRQRRNSQ